MASWVTIIAAAEVIIMVHGLQKQNLLSKANAYYNIGYLLYLAR